MRYLLIAILLTIMLTSCAYKGDNFICATPLTKAKISDAEIDTKFFPEILVK